MIVSQSHPSGEKAPQPSSHTRPASWKLTPEAVREIRAAYKPYSRTHGSKALAYEFGVSRKTIEDAAKGNTWRGVE